MVSCLGTHTTGPGATMVPDPSSVPSSCHRGTRHLSVCLHDVRVRNENRDGGQTGPLSGPPQDVRSRKHQPPLVSCICFIGSPTRLSTPGRPGNRTEPYRLTLSSLRSGQRTPAPQNTQTKNSPADSPLPRLSTYDPPGRRRNKILHASWSRTGTPTQGDSRATEEGRFPGPRQE